jgi:hypothetical protein
VAKRSRALRSTKPTDAIGEADKLVQEVMTARGYPITDFEQQAADISVDHPEVMTNYRAGPRRRRSERYLTRLNGGPAPGDGPLPRPVQRPPRHCCPSRAAWRSLERNPT